MSNLKTTLIMQALFTALILSGCNGNSGNSTSSEQSTSTKIDSTNATQIAAAAFASVDAVEGFTIQSDEVSGRLGNTSSGNFNYVDFVVYQISLIQKQNQLMGRGVNNFEAIAADKTLDCQVHIQADLASDFDFTIGDKITLTFDNCNYNSEVIVNGTIGITVTQASTVPTGTTSFELGLDTVLTDFKVDDDTSVSTVNGDLSILVSEDTSGDVNITLSGNSLNIIEGIGLVAPSIDLTNYHIDHTESVTGDYSISPHGTVNLVIPFVTVSASFSTITPFTGNDILGDGNPTAGELHLTGAAPSQAWVIAQPDGVNIQINIDLDGDDTVDQTLMTTWTELEDLL